MIRLGAFDVAQELGEQFKLPILERPGDDEGAGHSVLPFT